MMRATCVRHVCDMCVVYVVGTHGPPPHQLRPVQHVPNAAVCAGGNHRRPTRRRRTLPLQRLVARVCINAVLQMCVYMPLVITPAAAQRRHTGRLPVLSYIHTNGAALLRSAQPRPGLTRARCVEDELLIAAALRGALRRSIHNTNKHIDTYIYIFSRTCVFSHAPSQRTRRSGPCLWCSMRVRSLPHLPTRRWAAALRVRGGAHALHCFERVLACLFIYLCIRACVCLCVCDACGADTANYSNCVVHFLSCPNMHAVRESQTRLFALLHTQQRLRGGGGGGGGTHTGATDASSSTATTTNTYVWWHCACPPRCCLCASIVIAVARPLVVVAAALR